MIVFLFVFLSILSLCLLLWQISNLVSVFYGSPYVMANKIVIRQALKLAGLKKGDVFYDLGCGRGDVLIEAAKMGAKATGFEISPYYFLLAKLKVLIYQYNDSVKKLCTCVTNLQIQVCFSNINNVNFSKADVIYCYLLPKFLDRLTPKFKKELKKGSRLISIGFPIKTLKKGTEYNINSRKIFIYRF